MPIQSMNYDELNASTPDGSFQVMIGDYTMLGWSGDRASFSEFYRNGTDNFPESNWKIHININPAQLGMAWNLIYPILVKHKVNHFKVARQSGLMNKAKWLGTTTEATEEQRKSGLDSLGRISLGTQVTIYIPANGELAIQDVLKIIEKKLNGAGVIPGKFSKSDRDLGTYCSVRNDNFNQGYISYDKVSNYNPNGEKDPFRKKI